MNRANTYQLLTRYDEALADYDKAIEIMERLLSEGRLIDINDLAIALNGKAYTMLAIRSINEAIETISRAVSISKERLASSHRISDADYYANILDSKSEIFETAGRKPEAAAICREALAIIQKFSVNTPLRESLEARLARCSD